MKGLLHEIIISNLRDNYDIDLQVDNLDYPLFLWNCGKPQELYNVYLPMEVQYY